MKYLLTLPLIIFTSLLLMTSGSISTQQAEGLDSVQLWDLTDLDLISFRKGIILPKDEQIDAMITEIAKQSSSYNPTKDLKNFTKFGSIFNDETLFRLAISRISKKAKLDSKISDIFWAACYLNPELSFEIKSKSLIFFAGVPQIQSEDEDQGKTLTSNEIYLFIINNRDYPKLQRWNALFSFINHNFNDLEQQTDDLVTIIQDSHTPEEFQVRAKINLACILGGCSDPDLFPEQTTTFFRDKKIVYFDLMNGGDEQQALIDMAKELYDE